jgi:predicted glycogen debranching enzyme
MALPGLCLSTGDLSTALEVIDSMVARMKQGLFPTTAIKGKPAFKSADAPMWFIRALQQYEKHDPGFDMWSKYGKAIKEVMEIYRQGTSGIIRMLDNGLIYTDDGQNPLTWMDAVVDGRMVTPRTGLAVEVNALWYNAVCQVLKWSEKKDKAFYKSWSHLPELIRESFVDQFWDQDKGYLADYVNGEFKDYSVRPSQVIAVSVDHSPLDSEMKKSILDVVQSELLTPRGLRSLSPKNEAYEGVCEGNQEMRDRAYHQGTAWPWILEHYALGVLDVHKKTGQSQVKRIYEGFEDEMTVRGIGSISEIYDGNPPHEGRGTISQATSVAALLRIGEMIEGFN